LLSIGKASLVLADSPANAVGSEPFEDSELGLPSVEQAQELPAVIIRNLVSEDEIQELLAAAEADSSRFGSVSRDAHGVFQLRGPWETWYLHTGGWFQHHFPELQRRLLEATAAVDRESWHLLAAAPFARQAGLPVVRNAELHTVKAKGALPDPSHFDSGSLWTCDVMLARPGEDFGGGELQTPEGDCLTCHDLRCGDALVFPSHKRHCVAPVKWGCRQVLVLEFWHGVERTCAHRCLQRWGTCPHTVAVSRMERILRSGSGDTDDPVPLFG